ncbi:MAG TPA: DUF305 domain-containing protein [Candidatus Anaerobiospirillum stercoravium]|nr:DUF305 domain-containing protein [Candidatus Anaerobiospirillum stercoravium]
MHQSVLAATLLALSAVVLGGCSNSGDDEMSTSGATAHHEEVNAMHDAMLSDPELLAHVDQDWERDYIAMMGPMHEDMMQAFCSNDPDIGFVLGMIPHHEGAIAMAQIELKYGTDPQVRSLAQAIIDSQQPEIDMMRAFLKDQGVDPDNLPEPGAPEWQSQYLRATMPMHDLMLRAIVHDYNDPDVGFIVGMIPHHEGAIAMADFVLKHGQNAEIKALALSIINEQQVEISKFQQYLVDHKIKTPR